MEEIKLGKDLLGITFESRDVPIGTIIDFAGKVVPAGYLKCDGSTFSKTDYPELAAVLGTNVLPNLN